MVSELGRKEHVLTQVDYEVPVNLKICEVPRDEGNQALAYRSSCNYLLPGVSLRVYSADKREYDATLSTNGRMFS